MRIIIVAALALSLAACGQPAEAPPAETPAAEAEPAPQAEPAVDYGPYMNGWDSAEFSRFEHRVHAPEPGRRTLRLRAETDSPGGETVAVYPLRADGSRGGGRIVFVVADRDGEKAQATWDIPAEGLPVQVVVENAGGRRHAGGYTLSVE